ncbi:NADH-ubiquinone oxidoreductase-F iron-sulfur binding region domain-containing protein [Kineococcus sp. NPDC059986]|uniref:NADH-ubiquinone oxidoreductase-F iron-sulfur binding region domain-containing protein n=1 Tax=Kineococcus sp. NPDC059986 TaxID=3155538 RepID=UPI00344BD9DA
MLTTSPDRPAGTAGVPDLIDRLRRSGLQGRGGAARPVAAELDRVRAAGPGGVVVVNGVEGEPLSRKDATLLTTVPHLVLDGAVAAATTVGAPDVVVCAAAGPGLEAVRRAAGERGGVDGPVHVHVVAAAPGFVAGQESAVVAHLDGFAARPRGTGVPLWRSGLAGRPTVVKNVETLARTGLLARHGHQPDTVLLTLATAAGPRVLEVPAGSALDVVLDREGVATGAGVLLGGYHGTWTPSDVTVPLTVDAVRAGVVRPLLAGECPLAVTAVVVGHLAAASVRQCGPCTFGLPRLHQLTLALAAGRLDADGVHELRRTVGLLVDRGACRHPDASARTVASALTAFPAEVAAHRRGACLAARAVAA